MDYNYRIEGEKQITCWQWQDGKLAETTLFFSTSGEYIWEALNEYSYVSFAQFGDAVQTYIYACHYKPEPAPYLALSIVIPKGDFDPDVYCHTEIVLIHSWADLLAYANYMGAPISTWRDSDGNWDGEEGKRHRKQKS